MSYNSESPEQNLLSLLSQLSSPEAGAGLVSTSPVSTQTIVLDSFKGALSVEGISPTSATIERVDPATGEIHRLQINVNVRCTACGSIHRVNAEEPHPIKKILECGHSYCEDCRRPSYCQRCKRHLCFRCLFTHSEDYGPRALRGKTLCKPCSDLLSGRRR